MTKSPEDAAERLVMRLCQSESETLAAFAGTQPVSSQLLRALRAAGNLHLYAESADVEEVGALLTIEPGQRLAELDGNSVNQMLLSGALERLRREGLPGQLKRELTHQEAPELSGADRAVVLHAMIVARIGNEFRRSLGAGGGWETSLQVHMGLPRDPEKVKAQARLLHRSVPGCMVKIPFTPDEPSCLLVARDLELEGIPVNLTGTFSVRQVVAAALLSNASRTNVFLGRINQDLQSGFLAEHVCLEAQRTLRRLRADDEVQTLLIVARVPDWRALIRLAGCDVITAPCDVYRDFLSAGLSTHEVASRLKYSYAENLEIPKTVIQSIGRYQIAGLYRIQEEQIQLLRALRSSEEYRRMQSGEELRDALERAGFTGLFHSPSEEERAEIEQDDFSIPRTKLSRRLALDTLFSLRVDAEFRRRQEQIDQELGEWVDQ